MTMIFALEGAAYEIDLAPSGEQSAARAWLVDQGDDVPARGRLSAELLDPYHAR